MVKRHTAHEVGDSFWLPPVSLARWRANPDLGFRLRLRPWLYSDARSAGLRNIKNLVDAALRSMALFFLPLLLGCNPNRI
jgi:hypothetical protein